MNIILFKENEHHIDKSDPRAIHINKVLHLKIGDSFKAGIINGRQGSARILSDNDGLEFEFNLTQEPYALHPLTLIVAQVRPICMRRILRESVSLGVERLILPVSDLGEKSYIEASLYKNEEYKDILIDGAMQSGFSSVSECTIASGIEDAIRQIDDSYTRILLDNAIGAKALSSLDLRNKKVVLAIGPERGWSKRERDVFLSNGFQPVLLGDRILRTETASVAGAALALSRMGVL